MKTIRGTLLVGAVAAVVVAGIDVAAIAHTTVPTTVPTTTPATTQAADENDPHDRGWPRRFEGEGYAVTVYAPQVDEWPKFDRITFRAAVAITVNGSNSRIFGVLRVSANTEVALEDRLVVLTGRKVETFTSTEVAAADLPRLQNIVEETLPADRPLTVSLDRLIASLDPSTVNVTKVDVSTAPPAIFASNTPAILVQFMGEPRFQKVPDNSLQFAVNTNWDVFLDSAKKKYYLLNGESWLVTTDLDKGPWTSAETLPPALSRLPPDNNWADVIAAIPGVPAKEVPAVFVAHGPSELIVTEGEPALEACAGTNLNVVTNTESNVYFDTANKQYYFLAAGRWFTAAALAGPWSAASASLPDDFQKLPATEDNADVLTSIPGTPAAEDAVVLASIPQKATINRADLTVDVTYEGAPVFMPIETTVVDYATNTPFSVFRVAGSYYCCYNAVWFESASPHGKWVVCSAVPPAIYTIPPTSPLYNVTYVHVYDQTPTTVVAGYSAGYSGATVAATGVVMFGLGALLGAAIDSDNFSFHIHSGYYSYGCGAVYRGGYGGFVTGGNRYYGPYGGAGYAAAYNPATGGYSRAGYAYGPRGAVGARSAYSPVTGIGGARAGGVGPYGAWRSGVVSNGDRWIAGSQRHTAAGSAGVVRGSEGGAIARAEGRYGNGVTVARDRDGDYYAAKNGNVYRRDDNNGWQEARGNNGPRANSQSNISRATSDELGQQAGSRDRGDASAQRATNRNGGGHRATGGGGRRHR